MHDIRLIRNDPDGFDTALARRGIAPAAADFIRLDADLRAVQTTIQERLARRNSASKEIGAAKAAKQDDRAQELMAEVAAIKQDLPEMEAQERDLRDTLSTRLAALPNLPDDTVPDGLDETGNVTVSQNGVPPDFAFPAQEHDVLAASLGLDLEAAARMSGARFAVLTGDLARLHRALGQFMLDMQTREHGYLEVQPPLLVRGDAAFGVGQLPKFAEDLFRTTDDHWLISTGEVPLTNMVRERILDPGDLPLRLTALTPCFRSEAGAAGRDTRGLIRQHQFDKVELVSVCMPDAAQAEHERMTACAEAVLARLGLAWRRVLLCAGDMGFAAQKTYDLEVWLPGQNSYREISSCSTCGDFQARRMNARVRGDGGTLFPHTLNGSGLAVGRTLVAILENYQDEGGAICVPEALRPFMGGQARLEPR